MFIIEFYFGDLLTSCSVTSIVMYDKLTLQSFVISKFGVITQSGRDYLNNLLIELIQKHRFYPLETGKIFQHTRTHMFDTKKETHTKKYLTTFVIE